MRDDCPPVAVLLSTYNGERYLSEQIESILSQDYPNLSIVVRDDGSTDGTLEILNAYTAKGITLHEGKNIGFVDSFFTLLAMPSKAQHFFFADQDDVWLPGKISRAVNWLESRPDHMTPALYCARLRIVDHQLKGNDLSPALQKRPSFANALVENIATGCTMALNRASRDLLVHQLPGFAWNHDWWANQVVSAFGEVHYDPVPALLYRQHDTNVTGMGGTVANRLKRKVIRQLHGGNRGGVTRQARELERIFGSALPPEPKSILDGFLRERPRLPARLEYVLRCPLYRQSPLDNIAFKILYLFNRI